MDSNINLQRDNSEGDKGASNSRPHQSNSLSVELRLILPPPSSIGRFLILPEVKVPPKQTISTIEEPLNDYSKSIFMTLQEYITALNQKAIQKEMVQSKREEEKSATYK